MQMFGGGGGYTPPAPAPTPAVPTREDPAVEEARRREAVASRSKRGRGATLIARYASPDSETPLMMANGAMAGGSASSLVLGG